MKLKKININKLFGVFDHEVKLNNNSGITIIIGENGLGKTVILESIEAFFQERYSYFNTLIFDSIIFEFDDNIKWVLSNVDLNERYSTLKLYQIKEGKSSKPFSLENYQNDNIEKYATMLAKKYQYFRRIGARRWEDMRTGQIVRSEWIIEHYGESRIITRNVIGYPYERENVPTLFDDVDDRPSWFKERHNKIKVSLIETQRLISIKEKEDKSHTKTVEKHSQELATKIKSYLSQSTELSSKLDRTYPNRLIDRLAQSSNITVEDLNNELNRLESQRKLLDAVGLIEIEKDSNILKIDNSQDFVREVLKLYVEDSFDKIEIFQPLANKIRILLAIINRRFKHKRLYIDKDKGFLFKSTIIVNSNNEPAIIPLTKLSSGEQNELILFYLLLFNTEENSLILIDEPEVSLHISWQNSFIEDLTQIIQLNNLDVVIATHSPDIIGNNWDLKIELKGLE